MLETSNFLHTGRPCRSGHRSCDEWVFPKWAWSGSSEQFLHCGLRKFRHSKSSVYRWYTQLDHRRFVYDTYKTVKWLERVSWLSAHRPTLTLQFHDFDLFRTCRTSSFCTVAWQLARFQLTRRIARSLCDSWASCLHLSDVTNCMLLGHHTAVTWTVATVTVATPYSWLFTEWTWLCQFPSFFSGFDTVGWASGRASSL